MFLAWSSSARRRRWTVLHPIAFLAPVSGTQLDTRLLPATVMKPWKAPALGISTTPNGGALAATIRARGPPHGPPDGTGPRLSRHQRTGCSRRSALRTHPALPYPAARAGNATWPGFQLRGCGPSGSSCLSSANRERIVSFSSYDLRRFSRASRNWARARNNKTRR